MIPPEVDMDTLSSQLTRDRVAFSDSELAKDRELNEHISGLLAHDHGIAVVDVEPANPADVRDIAQGLRDATGLDTVIVQSLTNVSTVSESYSRAELESAQQALRPGIDQPALLAQLYEHLDTFSVPWFSFGVIAVALVIVVAMGAWGRARRHR